MAITPQDKAFVGGLLKEGKTLDEAYLILKDVKAKKGITGGSFMTRAASMVETAPKVSPELEQKATAVKEQFPQIDENIKAQSKIDEIKPSLGESVLTAVGGPVLGAAPEILTDAYQSAKTLGGGLLKQAETAAPIASAITGNLQPLMDELKQPPTDKGTGLKETVQGAMGIAGSPVTGFLKDQLGEEKANAVMEVINAPFDWATDKTFTTWAKSQGIDTTTPEFQESRDQFVTALQLFSTIAAPKVMAKAKDLTETVKGGGAGLGQKFIASTNKIDPTKTIEFEKMTKTKPGEWLQERGIIKPRAETISELVEYWKASKDAVDTTLAKVEGRFKDKSVSKILEDQVKYFTETGDRANLSLTKKRLQTLTDEGLTLSEVNSVKRLYESTEKFGYAKDLNSTKVQRATNLDSSVREFLINTAEERGFKNIRELNKETQAAKFLADEIYKKMQKQESNNVLGLTDQIMAMGGLIDPKVWAGLGIKKILLGEAGKSYIANLLSPEATKGIPPPTTKLVELKSKQKSIQDSSSSQSQMNPKASIESTNPIQETVPPPTGKSSFNTAGAAESASSTKPKSVVELGESKTNIMDALTQEAKKYKSAEEFRAMTFNKALKLLRGVEQDSIVTVPTKQIKIIWKDDYINAKETAKSSYDPNTAPPVELIYDLKTGKYKLDDGHNRFVAAERNNQPVKGEITKIEGNMNELDSMYEKETGISLTDIWNKANGK